MGKRYEVGVHLGVATISDLHSIEWINDATLLDAGEVTSGDTTIT